MLHADGIGIPKGEQSGTMECVLHHKLSLYHLFSAPPLCLSIYYLFSTIPSTKDIIMLLTQKDNNP